MFSNPLVQTVLLFFGAYTFMTMLKRYDPAHLVVTGAAGVVALVIWMLRYNRPGLYKLYQNPLFKSVIDLVCSMTGEQAPVDAVSGHAAPRAAAAMPPQAASARPRAAVSARSYAQPPAAPVSAGGGSSGSAPATKQPLLLLTDSDARLAAFSIKERLFGLDATIDQTLQQIARNIRVRERSLSTVQLPPLGLFLFTGRSGLGKRTLAIEIGRRLYAGDAVAVIDLSEPGQTLEAVVASAKANAYQTFIVENVDLASRRAQDDLLAIVSGQSLTDSQSGSRVTFRHCCFFLLVHKDASAEGLPVMSGARDSSFTVAVERTTDSTSLDAILTQGLHGLVPFHMPDKVHQAEVVAMLMAQECQKHQLTLRSISPRQLAREVQEVSTIGSFRATPARITRVMSRAIHEAIEAKATVVDVT